MKHLDNPLAEGGGRDSEPSKKDMIALGLLQMFKKQDIKAKIQVDDDFTIRLVDLNPDDAYAAVASLSKMSVLGSIDTMESVYNPDKDGVIRNSLMRFATGELVCFHMNFTPDELSFDLVITTPHSPDFIIDQIFLNDIERPYCPITITKIEDEN